MFVGFDIKPEKQIVRETRLHIQQHVRMHAGTSLLNQMNQLLELLAMVNHEGEFIS